MELCRAAVRCRAAFQNRQEQVRRPGDPDLRLHGVLPVTASEEGLPLLVPLHKDTFNYAVAKPDGVDVRFFRRRQGACVSNRAMECGGLDGEHLDHGTYGTTERQ